MCAYVRVCTQVYLCVVCMHPCVFVIYCSYSSDDEEIDERMVNHCKSCVDNLDYVDYRDHDILI